MEDSVQDSSNSDSDCSSVEYATDVEWSKLPDEIWLQIFSHLPQYTLLTDLRLVSRLFNSLAFDPSLWKVMDLTDWIGHSPLLIAFIEALDRVIDRVSQHLRVLSFCEESGKRVFGSYKRWLFYEFSHVVHLELIDCDVIRTTIMNEIRQHCTKIETLVLDGCSNVDDEAMKVVSKFEHLSILDISGCSQVTDEGVNYIAEMPCQITQFISFDVWHLSDKSIVNLVNKQTKIEILTLYGDDLTDKSVIDACHCLPNLKNFEIFDCTNLTDGSVYALCGKVSLERLHFQRATKNISTKAINHLFQEKPLVNLKDLSVSFTDAVVDETVNAISSGCPNLKNIELDWCSEVTDESIDYLVKSCRKLEFLCLNGLTKLKGNWLAEIDHYLPKLQSLTIAFCTGISDDKIKNVLLRQPDLLVSSNEKGCEEVARRGDVDFVVRQITLEDFD
ncbi:unnamed protein product [Clavelina lepadiformis]|uniref:F-box domain-containing protein n=1 Tax=Clavelina lepadiformis TaxID=159417 RepID=A0ABP0FCH7_CLALP